MSRLDDGGQAARVREYAHGNIFAMSRLDDEGQAARVREYPHGNIFAGTFCFYRPRGVGGCLGGESAFARTCSAFGRNPTHRSRC